MVKVNVKPLSVNNCWQGKRFKTKQYKVYEQEVAYQLPAMKIGDGPLKLALKVGFSSPLADIDNFIKPFLDIMQKRYGFNDKQVYEIHAIKEIVKKGEEYICFDISPIVTHTGKP